MDLGRKNQYKSNFITNKKDVYIEILSTNNFLEYQKMKIPKSKYKLQGFLIPILIIEFIVLFIELAKDNYYTNLGENPTLLKKS